jgi:hypothetical protein
MLAASHRDRQAIDLGAAAEGRERPFGVIAGRGRLHHAGGPLGVQTREEDRALDLRARRLGLVRNRVQPCAVDRDRRVAVGRLDAGAHALQRPDDAAHRPAGQRSIPDHRRRKGVAGQHAGQQPHRGAGVAGVERRGGRTELTETSSQYSDRAVRRLFHLDAQGAQAAQRRPAVCPGSEMCQCRPSVGERGEQGIAVRDRFIARNGEPAAQAAGRRDDGGGRRHVDRILRDLAPLGPHLDFTGEMVLIGCRVAHT